jgi:hypothetical protein
VVEIAQAASRSRRWPNERGKGVGPVAAAWPKQGKEEAESALIGWVRKEGKRFSILN